MGLLKYLVPKMHIILMDVASAAESDSFGGD